MKRNTLYLAQAGIIAALYVVLTVIFAPISFRDVQVRIAEGLVVLPFFTPAAVPGLFVGCVLANILGGAIPVDVVFGSLATLTGAFLTWKLRNKSRFLAPVPAIVSNTVIVPFVLRYGYGIELPIPLMMFTVGLGEVISAGVLGMIILNVLNRYRTFIFRQEQLPA